MQESSKTPILGYVLGTIAVLALLFWILCIRVVGVGQVGVVTRLGNVNREVQSGIALKLPWPVETLSKFDIKTQRDEVNAAAASADLQDVSLTLVTNYSLNANKVGELYRTVGTGYKQRIVDPAIQEAIKATTAQFPIQELITKRPQVKQKALENLATRLEKRGINVEDVSITNMSFSKEFTQAIEQKQVAEQKVQEANFALQRVQKEAEAQRAQRESLTAEILQKMAIEKWNGVLPSYLGAGTVFNIPLK